MKDGLKIEAAASIVARDLIEKHLSQFAHVVRHDRAVSQLVIAAYIDGIAGAVALTIAAGHGSKEEVLDTTIRKFYEAVNRDLQHLRRT